ncbi:MAG: hypothetical protein EAZ92_01420 [Candidatus Kapaibacterium sp.]|nr:MAG: hypothetical protein EAZ92_01420 [Candidatus Kapabacteria bacterium]
MLLPFFFCLLQCLAELTAQKIEPLPSSVHFGSVILGKSTTQTLFLQMRNLHAQTPQAQTPLTVLLPQEISLSTNGEAGRFFTTQTLIVPSSSGVLSLTLRWKAASVGRFEGCVRVSSASQPAPVLIPLFGEGIARSPETVRFAHERLYVRDEAFFPLGWSQIGTRDNTGAVGKASTHPDLRGVNFLENEGVMGAMNVGAGGDRQSIWKADGRDYNNPDTIRHYLRRYLDTCQKGGVKTILNFYEYYPYKETSAREITGKAGAKILMERKLSDTDIQAIIGDSIIRNHPSLLGWWISSEPVGKYGAVLSSMFDGKRNPYNRALSPLKSLQEANARVEEYYPLQREMSRWYRMAKAADGFKHPIGTMFQAGSALEMTGMLYLYPNPNEPFWDFALAEHYNSPATKANTGLLYEIFERCTPLQDSVLIKNGSDNGNFFYRNFRTAPPTTSLTQDDKMMNRDVRDYFTRFHPLGTAQNLGVSGGGIILKLFGQKYEGDGEQNVRPATLGELMFTTFTQIHALQNYPRPTVLGGIDIFGYDFFSSKVKKTDGNGTTTSAWGVTEKAQQERKAGQDFIAFFAKYNLGMAMQSGINPDWQGEEFLSIAVEHPSDSVRKAAAQAIKRIVRYHDGYVYCVLVNNRLNEEMPPSLTTSTVRYAGWGANQEFVTTANVRLSLPPSSIVAECVEVSPRFPTSEQRWALQDMSVQNSWRQILTLERLDAAETRVFRLRLAQHPARVLEPSVSLVPRSTPQSSASPMTTTKNSRRSATSPAKAKKKR